MKEKLTWAAVIFVSMVLGGGVVIGADSLRDDSPSASASPQVIERTVNAAGGVAMTAQQDVSELYARVKRIDEGSQMVELDRIQLLGAAPAMVVEGLAADRSYRLELQEHLVGFTR